MQRPMDRRSFLARALAAVGGLTGALTLHPRLGSAQQRSSSTGITPHQDPYMWFALDPEWGAGAAGCPVDAPSAHGASHACHGCTACHKHAANKLFASWDAANTHRAHAGCYCRPVIGGSLDAEVWLALFGPRLDTDTPYVAVDRRWSWVAAILSPDDEPTCVADTNQYFDRTWKRTDKPVADSVVARTWMWGPEPFTCVFTEPYLESPGGQRQVQYYDKSRMEITHPDGDTSSIWYVTNGLLTVELITGRRQVGDDTFEQHLPAQVNVAGDADDPTGPTYASFAGLLDSTVGFQETAITRVIHRDGTVSVDQDMAAYVIGTAIFQETTQHWVATPFWTFMNASGLVYNGDALVTAPYFVDPYYATGLPITEAFWASVKVADTYRDVLIQCFERRVLTYTPSNPPEWRVEMGNIGRHYHTWRYSD